MDLSDDELPHMYLKHVTSLKQRIHQTMEQGAQTVLTESVCVSTNACLGLYLTSTTDSLTTRRRRGALTTRSLSVLNENLKSLKQKNASSYGTSGSNKTYRHSLCLNECLLWTLLELKGLLHLLDAMRAAG